MALLQPHDGNTKVANKDFSKREWAFNRVDAVLEFASPEDWCGNSICDE